MKNSDLGPLIYEMNVGDEGSVTRHITRETILGFADAIDDHDPIHVDPEYAKTTIFGKNIAHGVYIDCAMSAVTSVLVKGGINAKLSVKYTDAVYAGDTITVTGVVQDINLERNRIYIEMKAVNQNNGIVAIGEAVCLARTEE